MCIKEHHGYIAQIDSIYTYDRGLGHEAYIITKANDANELQAFEI